MRKTRPNHSQLSPEARKKANTRAYTKEYIRRGYIKKQPCLVCGNKNSEAHHENYDKPLEIIWLCRAHHLELHNKKHNATKG